MIERWNSGEHGLETIAPYCDPAIELYSPLSSVTGEPYRGLAGLERWVRDLEEQFSQWQIDVEELREVGQAVLALSTIRARGRASGVDLEFPSAGLLYFGEHGLLRRIRIHADVGAALAELGLDG